MKTVHLVMKVNLTDRLIDLEGRLDANVMTLISGIAPGVDSAVRTALDAIPRNELKPKLAIVLQTTGGVVAVVERMVQYIRSIYSEVVFIVPESAMSAGTLFALSGDDVMMDSFSVLGPIDPQVQKQIDGTLKLVPALSYLTQWEAMIERSKNGQLTNAEFALLSRLDLAELQQFEEAKELSIELLKDWLTKYKFKNWVTTKTHKTSVTPALREQRARQIATALCDHTRWVTVHSPKESEKNAGAAITTMIYGAGGIVCPHSRA